MVTTDNPALVDLSTRRGRFRPDESVVVGAMIEPNDATPAVREANGRRRSIEMSSNREK